MSWLLNLKTKKRYRENQQKLPAIRYFPVSPDGLEEIAQLDGEKLKSFIFMIY